MRVASPALRTSPATKPARSPISSTVSSSTSSRRPATTTVAPAAASSIAACLPRFVPPPVTRTTRPSSASGAKISDGPGKRGTQESNLALRFWRPPCYRYTSPPAAPEDSRRRGLPVRTLGARKYKRRPWAAPSIFRSFGLPPLGQQDDQDDDHKDCSDADVHG